MLSAFIIILIGTVLVGSLADSIYEASNLNDVTNESITIASGTGQTANVDLTTISYFGNVSNNTRSIIINVNADVNFTKAGVITVSQNITTGTEANNTIFSNGLYNISYTYEPSGYVTDSTSRTLLNLIVLFFVIAILVVGYNLVMKSFSDFF